MIMHPPFIITARLVPGLNIGDTFLNLLGVMNTDEGRQVANLVLDFPDGSTYEDSTLQSGCGGFKGCVELFETYLSFLLACVEGYEYEQHNPGYRSDNSDLFPPHIREWAVDNKLEIENIHCDLQDEDGNIRKELITS